MGLSRDPVYQRCLELARKPKSSIMRFGALIIKDGRIIGEGWNRRVRKGEKPPFPVGYAYHAEQAALADAINSGYDPSDAAMYIAGEFADGSTYLPTERFFTCVTCANKLVQFRMQVFIPVIDHWEGMTAEEAQASAKELKKRGTPVVEERTRLSLKSS